MRPRTELAGRGEADKTRDKARWLDLPETAPDPFAPNAVYPDSEAIFTFKPVSINEAKTSAIVVPDTNVLLVPYLVGQESLDKIRSIFEALVSGGRLCIPGRVAREFAKHRSRKIGEVFHQLKLRRDMRLPEQVTYPLLESVPHYITLKTIEEELSVVIDGYRKQVGKLLDDVRGWIWNDPVRRNQIRTRVS